MVERYLQIEEQKDAKNFVLNKNQLSLKKTTHYQSLNKHGRALSSKLFLVKYWPCKNLPGLDVTYNYCGITITKKTAIAVKRNLLKRRLRHIFREHKYQSSGLAFNFYLKPQAKTANFLELKKEVENCLEICITRHKKSSQKKYD